MLKITERVEGNSALGAAFFPGVYENGLLTITTEADSRDLAESLEWDIYHDYRVVAHNCMGDLFIQKEDSAAIGYVWLQYGYGRFIANNADDWLLLIEQESEDKTKFLETNAHNYLHSNKGPIPYGCVYTMAPILALGGDATLEGLDRCDIGHLDVYLSIVSQSFLPEQWGEFA